MSPKILSIEYADPHNLSDITVVEYQIETHPVAIKWANSVLISNKKYSIDEPERFYGIGSVESQSAYAVTKINNCVDIINSHQPIINRYLESIDDQDTLNYLHNVFEQYHGLLDQQTSDFWSLAPENVRIALARLNTLVHRCEGVQRNYGKHHLVTWYQCPKILCIKPNELDLFKTNLKAGTVFLLYAQIGKTLDALAEDNDQYIGDDAFKPFNYYGPDFGVCLDSTDKDFMDKKILQTQIYYEKHKEFFVSRGYSWELLKKSIGWIPLANILDVDKINEILHRPLVKSINFS